MTDNLTSDETSELGLGDIVKICIKNKFIILAAILIFAGAGAVVAVMQATYYSSEMLVKPRDEEGAGNSSPSGGLASLGALTGGIINGGNSKSETLIEHIKSRVFILSFITKNKLEADVFAAKGWDEVNDKLIYDEDIYDVANKKWRSEDAKPNPLELYHRFMDDFFILTYDDKKDLILLQIKYYNPKQAYEWMVSLSNEANEYLKRRSQITAEKRMDYLQTTLTSTANNTIQRLTGDLIKEQMRSLMMTNFNDGFAFEVIDPPILAHEPMKSNLPIFTLFGAFFGFFISLFVVLSKGKEKKDLVN